MALGMLPATAFCVQAEETVETYTQEEEPEETTEPVTEETSAPETEPELPASNTCGEDLIWEMAEGILTVSGTGAMADYADPSDVPWYADSETITTVVIADGVTWIDENAFSACSNLKDVYFGGEQWAEEWVLPHTQVCVHTSCTSSQNHWQIKRVDPTCTEDGTSCAYCSCGFERDAVPLTAPGHAWGEWTQTQAPTCTEAGSERRDCANCEAFETREVAAGHNHQATVTAPTCTEQGYTTHTCACGDTYVDAYVDALGHAWDAGVVTTEPTEEAAGVLTYTCGVCGDTKTEEIPKQEHSHRHTTVVTDPTCTEQGYTTYTCTCGDTYQDNYTDALGHDYESTVVSFYTKPGYTEHICSRCADAYQDTPTNAKGLPKPNVKVSNDANGDPVLTWKADGEASYYRVYRATSKNGTYKSYAKTTKNTYTDKKTTVGKTYYYKVKAVCSSDSKLTSDYSTYDKAYSKCATPVVTITISNKTGKPTVKWSKVTGAKQYEVSRATSENGTYKVLKTVTAVSYADTSVKVGTTYYYKVKAIASGSSYHSANSVPQSCVPVCARPEVTVTIDSTTGKPFLKWSRITGAVGYDIYRAGAEGGYERIAENYAGISYTDKEAQPDTDYRYKVKAIGKTEALNSKYSVIDEVHTTLAKPVVSFTTDAATGKPKLTWEPVEGAKWYRVYRSSYAEKSYKLKKSPSATEYIDTSVDVGESYYYKVIAVGENSKSAYSTYQKVTGKCAPVVATVKGREEGGLTVSWKKVTGAKKYEVYRKNEGGTYAKVATVSTLSYADTKAPQNQVSYYKVRAYGDSTASRGAFSATVSALNHTLSGWKVLKPATPEAEGLRQRHCTGCDLVEQQVLPKLTVALKVPSIKISTDSSTGKPKLTWKSVDKATGYYVYLYDSETQTYQFLGDTTRTSYHYADAVPGDTYAFSVVAVNSKNCSRYSAVNSVLCKCAAPKLTLSRNQETDCQILSWQEIQGAKAYEVYVSGAQSTGYSLYTTTTSTSVEITDLPAGVQYYYKVRALHKNTEANSAMSSATTQSRTVDKLVIHVGKISEKCNRLAWEKVKDAKTYKIYRSANGGSYKLLKTVYSTDYVDLNVKAGTTYRYVVKAYNADKKLLTSSPSQAADGPSMKPIKIYLSPSSQIHNPYKPYAKMQTTEAIQCREIATLTKAALERCGFEVKANVTAEDYKDRVKESNSWGANLHVPIHTNGYKGKYGGTQVYHDGVEGSDSYKAAQAIFDVLAPLTPGNTMEYTRKHDGLYESNQSKAPVAYIEAEFHDSYKYSKWIVANKDKIAEAICEGICNLYGMPYIAP